MPRNRPISSSTPLPPPTPLPPQRSGFATAFDYLSNYPHVSSAFSQAVQSEMPEPSLSRELRQMTEGHAAALRQLEIDAARHRQAVRSFHRFAEQERERLISAQVSGSARPHATPSERYLRRSHARLRNRSNFEDTIEVPPLPNTRRRECSPGDEGGGSRRQFKRRRLNPGLSQVSDNIGFRYGWKGQVIPGQLQMDIASCKGGECVMDFPSPRFRVENIFRQDSSYYCSEGRKCSLLLKHKGGTPFSVEELVIHVPDNEMAFIGNLQRCSVAVLMSLNDIPNVPEDGFKSQIRWRAPSEPLATSPNDSQRLSFQEAIEDPQLWEQSRRGMEERIERLHLRRRSNEETDRQSARDWEAVDSDSADDENTQVADNCPYYVDEGSPNAAGISAPSPPFSVTAENHHENVQGDATLWAPGSLNDQPTPSGVHYSSSNHRNALNGQRSHTRHASNNADNSLLHDSGYSNLDVSHWDPDKPMPYHAQFNVGSLKRRTTVTFSPALTGRYLVLTIETLSLTGYAGLEKVEVNGYNGPRLFPATKVC